MRRQFGGGYLLNWGPHIVEPAYWLLDTTVVSVCGFLQQALHCGDCEDTFFAQLDLANGSRALVEHTICPHPLPRWVIQGRAGAVLVDGDTIKIAEVEMDPASMEIAPNSMPVAIPCVTHDEPCPGPRYGDQTTIYRQLEVQLREGGVTGFDSGSALHLSDVLDAIRLSDEQGKGIKIPLD